MNKKDDYSKYYTIIRTIGQSGFCYIYEAQNKKTEEKKALKVMELGLIKQDIRSKGEEPTEKKLLPYIECFYNEAKYMNILQGQNNFNENAVLLDEFFENKNEMAISMELCDTNLFDHLSDKEVDLNSEEIYYILKQLNNSFEIMNKNKILHRNLRIENILIKYENKEKDKDKFIAKLKLTNDCCLEDSSNKLLPEKISDDCKIYAPEVLNSKEYTEESDLWSLGILIYLLSFKEYPFIGENNEEVLSNIQNINLTGLKKTDDEALNDLIKKLLALKPEDRLSWEQYFNHSFFKNNPLNDYTKYYEIIDTIGQGSYGAVKIAKNKISGEKVAIKIIDKNLLKNDNDFSYQNENIDTNVITKELKDEINIMKIIEGKNKDNKNTVKLYEYFNMEKKFSIVMELCDGNLKQYLKKRKNAFNSSEIYELLTQLNNTFRIMYENKIVHRDFKLENILYKIENDKVIFKLIDYGGAKQIIKTLETINTRIGTIPYMSPEMLDDSKKSIVGKTDLWSLGVIIYILCFRETPYNAENTVGLLNQINSSGSNSLKKTNVLNLDNLIKKLLVKKPEERISWKEYFNHEFFKNKK